jgi:hypothetical protein
VGAAAGGKVMMYTPVAKALAAYPLASAMASIVVVDETVMGAE